MPSPQSPGTSPTSTHSGYGELVVGGMPPRLLPSTRLPVICTSPIECPASEPVARIPSPSAPVTVSPSTATWLDLMVMPARHGAVPGPCGPSWTSGFATTTSSVYVPRQTTTLPPTGAASTAAWTLV